MTVPAFSVVVVAWNSAEALETCIGSLRESAAASATAIEIVIVDNASSDDSLATASRLGCDVVVSNPLNAGYGVAAMQGLARATGRWVLLVNPDVVVRRDFVAALAAAAESSPEDVATLAPDVRFASDESIVNFRGVEVDDAGVPTEIQAATRASNEEAPREVFGGSSGACLLRLDAVRRVGSIEPAFFAYMEDVDLAWQLRRAGYRALFVPDAVALHEGSASVGADSPLKAFLVARSRRLLFRLNGPHTLRARARRTVVELGHGTFTSLSGAGAAPWRGRADALRLRAYTAYVRRARSRVPVRLEPTPAPRVSLAETLRRKRAMRRAMIGE